MPLVAYLAAVLQLICVVLGQMIRQPALAAEGAIALGAGILQHLADLGDLVVHRLDVRGQIVLRVERLVADGAAKMKNHYPSLSLSRCLTRWYSRKELGIDVLAYVIHELGGTIEHLVAALEIRIPLMDLEEVNLQLGQVLGAEVAQITVGIHVAGDRLLVALGELSTRTAFRFAFHRSLQLILRRLVCCCGLGELLASCFASGHIVAALEQLIQFLGECQCALFPACHARLSLRLKLVLQLHQRHFVCKAEKVIRMNLCFL